MDGSDATTTGSVDNDDAQFAHTDPQGDAYYTYQVRGWNSVGNSEWTTAVKARVGPAPQPAHQRQHVGR